MERTVEGKENSRKFLSHLEELLLRILSLGLNSGSPTRRSSHCRRKRKKLLLLQELGASDASADHGARKPPLPLQLVQPRTSVGSSLPSSQL
ncbi:hypothetical protein VNO77_39184 [Canavalia gladiata]|uniref:Uncharacterized protein n=1 Tax=Canavalia gladiata TaxID=3824 RepID=A0AAN9KAM6_CANGL